MFPKFLNFLKKFHPKAERDPRQLYPHDHLMRVLVLPFIPPFIHPNHITILRFILTPVVLWFLIREQYEIGVPLFLFTAFTDAIDGSLARARKQVSEWGTIADPVADKILIGLVVLLFVIKHLGLFLGFLILFFELAIVAIAFLHKQRGEHVSANVFGKVKMFLQVSGVMFLFISLWANFDLFHSVSFATLTLAVLFAVLSLLSYGL